MPTKKKAATGNTSKRAVRSSRKPTLEELQLDVALAWVFARNHDFNTVIDRDAPSPIAVAFAAFNASQDVKQPPVVVSVEKAWMLLRAAILEGGLELRGVPFRKAEPSQTLETFELLGSGPPRAIPRDIIAGLLIDETSGELRLRPKGWTTSHEHWWRLVEVAKEEIFARFQEISVQDAVETSAPSKPKKMSRKYRLITLAITAIWPEGNVMDPPGGDRNEIIIEWVREHLKNENEKKETKKKEAVSTSQIYRYFRDLGLGLIDGF